MEPLYRECNAARQYERGGGGLVLFASSSLFVVLIHGNIRANYVIRNL